MQKTNLGISFDDTSVAFHSRPNHLLIKGNLLFTIISYSKISNILTKLLKIALWLKLPVTPLIKRTIFDQFCGGVTIEDCESTINQMWYYNVGTILDYSVEGEKNVSNFESTKFELIRAINIAKNSSSMPFCVFKMSSISSPQLLEKIQSNKSLHDAELAEFKSLKKRLYEICSVAHEADVPVLIDAEESWIQKTIDDLTYEMMKTFNQEKVIVYNTIQMYCVHSMNSLRESLHYATMYRYQLGIKLVRGAYMEKENYRVTKMNHEKSPIFPSKDQTDDNFNQGLKFCIENKQRISLVCGSHNEYSNYYLTVLMEKFGMKNNDHRIWFAQLYGMSDNISYNLAKAGYNVAKYLPYGPVKSVIPYLLRRAQENTSINGQSSRELTLIRRELKRRKKL